MEKAEVYKLMDILEDVKKIEALRSMHHSLDDSDFMITQYEEKKAKLIGIFIDMLISPKIQSPQSFFLIESILHKYYPLSDYDIKYDEHMAQIAAAL